MRGAARRRVGGGGGGAQRRGDARRDAVLRIELAHLRRHGGAESERGAGGDDARRVVRVEVRWRGWR